MSLNAHEIGQLIGFARAVIVDVDNEVAVSGGNADGDLVFGDLAEVAAAGYARDTLAALINRAYREMPELHPLTTELAES